MKVFDSVGLYVDRNDDTNIDRYIENGVYNVVDTEVEIERDKEI